METEAGARRAGLSDDYVRASTAMLFRGLPVGYPKTPEGAASVAEQLRGDDEE